MVETEQCCSEFSIFKMITHVSLFTALAVWHREQQYMNKIQGSKLKLINVAKTRTKIFLLTQ